MGEAVSYLGAGSAREREPSNEQRWELVVSHYGASDYRAAAAEIQLVDYRKLLLEDQELFETIQEDLIKSRYLKTGIEPGTIR